MAISAGTKLGPYEILAPIGKGGMGEVWKARDTRLGRDVAIKISSERFSERFDREARSIAALNHPNICHLYDVGPNYLVMELVDGPTLLDRIKEGSIPLEEALNIARQVADALESAHEKGIVHRDLKPGNIKIKPDGTVKVLDFGLAKMGGTPTAHGDESPTLTIGQTEAGVILGTASYMSPEQAKGKPVDARSDIYAFGVVLYEMITGKRLHGGDTTTEVLASVIKEEPQWDKVPPQVQKLLRRCLEKDPQKRLRHIGDVMSLVDEAPAAPAAAPAARPVGSKWPWMAGAVALLLVATIGTWAIVHFRSSANNQIATRVQIAPPEGGEFATFGAFTGGFALSPDGKTVAYSVKMNGKTGLWVRALDGATARLLPGTEGAGNPFWSPDNKSIAFAAGRKLLRVDIAGGAPLAICEGSGCSPEGAWTGDGRIVLGGAGTGRGLYQVSAFGGTPSLLTTPDASLGEVSHEFPQVLPGGRLLYWALNNKAENSAVYATTLAKPAERVKLMTTESNAVFASDSAGKGYLLWLRGTTLMAQEFDPASFKLSGEPHAIADPVAYTGTVKHTELSASSTGSLLYTSFIQHQFTWFDRAGHALGKVGDAAEYITFRLSPDGRRIVVSRDLPEGTDLWLIDTERNVASRLTFKGIYHLPIWSPDSRFVVFRSFTLPFLFRKDTNGSNEEQRLDLPPPPGPYSAWDWSRDGRFLLYAARGGMWILPVMPDGTPAGKPKPYLTTSFFPGSGRFSPEPSPRWVAYQSNESGQDEVYVQAFPEPRGKFQISTGGGRLPQWGSGGREIFYVTPGYKLMVVSLNLGENSVEASAPRELFQLPSMDLQRGISPYDVAPDGQRFLVNVAPPQLINLIVNWPALLKKGPSAP